MVKVFKSEKGQKHVMESYDKLLAMWDVDFKEIDVETEFGTTHCITAGDSTKPPLLLFHGVGDNSAVMWILNIKELSKHFYCIAVDTIGGPGKSLPNNCFVKGNFDQVDWINQVADSLHLPCFNIAGVSNGACMAFNYAVREKDKIKRAVCLEGGMVTNPLKSIVKTLLLMFPEILVPNDNNLKKIMKKLTSPDSDFIEKHPEIIAHMVMVMKNHNQQAMFVHKLEKYNKEAAVPVKDKLYFLLGEYKIADKKDFIAILEDGGFKYNVIRGAGHGINHEQPVFVNQEVINFLV
jgi:pimeloyl-ACP methyl ester carboxylesterase